MLPKAVVYFVYLLEAVQTVLLTRDAFRVFGYGFGSMASLDAMAWIWFSVPIMSGIIGTTVQLFFAWRIYILSGRKWHIPALVSLVSVVGCGAAIWVGVYAKILNHFTGLPPHLYKQYSVWLGSTALVDTIITSCMVHILWSSRTGFKSTNSLLTKFVRLAVETAFVCSAVAIIELAMFVAFRNDSFYMCPARMLSKLYSNSLLALLNARMRIVGGRNHDSPSSYDATLSVMTTSDARFPTRGTDIPPNHNLVNIHISHQVDRDSDDAFKMDTTAYNGQVKSHQAGDA
ncbi:hypothetical protein VKT23_000165 [Stygiomarasmius scandens]|uniref:DUF6534 domain-containing protein n=1 Tax=Marasmiellus scandens TaxID=2682957 RepID=A0ABR1K616_9AGAR